MTDEDAGSYVSLPLCRSLTNKEENMGLGFSGGGGDCSWRQLTFEGKAIVAKKGQRSNYMSTLTGIDISVDLYIDMQVIFSLFEVIYNNYITQRIQFQFDKIASIQYSILLLLFMIT